ncbi:MAG: carbamate kinase, partial [Gemmatimonadetes bacterium]|nr:carbamate kinase [Gemmatimonadota bacterium]
MSDRRENRVVVALGGNAITQAGETGTIEQDYANLERSLECVADLVEQGFEVLLTHGNGPQVGNQMIRVEVAKDEAPILPLDIMGADIQGGLGYMIERVLWNKLRRRNSDASACCMLMMVEVDAKDPAFEKPTKFVGPFFRADQVARLIQEREWQMREDVGRGWRRVVPSPVPIDVVEKEDVMLLLRTGTVVITGGGGGIPVCRNEEGELFGIEAVIDKDLTSSVLATDVGAELLVILTAVDGVYLNFGEPNELRLGAVTLAECERYIEAGHFPPGS